MQNVLTPLVILGTISAGIVLFTRALTSYYLRKKMVEKGYVDKESVAILARKNEEAGPYANLKWALIIFFAGLALVVLEYIPYDRESPLPYGLFALSVSLGMLIHFFITRNNNKLNS